MIRVTQDPLNDSTRQAATFSWRSALLCLVALAGLTSPVTAQDQPQNQDPPAANGQQPAAGEQQNEKKEEEEEELPSLEEMQPLSVEQLMKGPPEDWVVLKKGDKVVVVQPVDERPNTLEIIQDRLRNPDKYEPKSIQFDAEGKRLRGEELAQARAVWRRKLVYLEVHMPFNEEDLSEDADKAYYIHSREIKEVIHFEDMMLKQIDQFLDEKKVSEAYEMVIVLRNRNDQWPGLEERMGRLLFAEAERQIEADNYEYAFVNLEELYSRSPDYPKLTEKSAEVSEHLISQAYDAKNLRKTRHFIRRMEAMYPQGRVVTNWTEKLLAETNALMDQARAVSDEGKHGEAVAIVEDAAKIWPMAQGLKPLYDRLSRRYQILRVGVLLQPQAEVTEISATPADERRLELTRARLFEPALLDGEIVRYRSRFLTEWEPTNLGRRINFKLRPQRQSWESQQVVSAMPMIEQMQRLITPRNTGYDERLSDRVSTVSLQSPYVFDVEFQQIPFRPEPLFTFPLDIPGPFQLVQQNDQLTTYRRTVPEPDDQKEFHVAEIVEVKYDSPEKAIQGFLRGQVDMLPWIPIDTVETFADYSAIFLQKYQLPKTYILQFNPRKKAMRSRSLRRAMSACVNSQKLLEEHVLKSSESSYGRLTSAPFPRNSYAYNTEVQAPVYDIELAIALAIIARKELGGPLPKLKLRSLPLESDRTIAQELIKSWARIGLEVELDESPTPGDDWDLVYRPITMHEPVVELWTLITGQSTAEISDLEFVPNWLRFKLVELDRISNWQRAETLMHDIHRDLIAEMQLIPLWEIDQFRIVRKTLRDVPENPISTYDGVEQWIVQPWYEKN